MPQKMFAVKQHLQTKKHKDAESKRNLLSNTNQTLISEYNNQATDTFSMELCEMFVKSNIPIKKVSCPDVKKFFEKYTNNKLPCESKLRQRCVPILYNKAINSMREKAENKCIWISIDETTDADQRLIVNFIFGILNGPEDNEEKGKSYLFNMSEVDAANANTMAAFVNDSLSLLWPKGIQYSNVLLLTTDAAAYMIAAGDALKVLYPNMLHLTCFAHGLHRLAEFIRSQYCEVNSLISSTKAIFVKAPARRREFKRTLPGLGLPPEPCITRWGSWLNAAEYYCNNFDAVKGIVDSFEADDAESIRASQKQFGKSVIKTDLLFLKINFSPLTIAIKTLQSPNLGLKEAVELILNLRQHLECLLNKTFKQKFEKILSRNKGFKSIVDIYNVSYKAEEPSEDYVKKLSPSLLEKFVFCPTTSVDVERSFSMFGNIFTEKRRSFTFENLKQHLIISANCSIEN